MLITVATDGSAINNPHGPAGWAWVIDKDRWNAGSFPKASNQAMEMFAIVKALEEIPTHLDIHIQTDSRFCVQTVGENGKTGWMKGWKTKGWKKADGKTPANLALLKRLDAALVARRGTVRLEWVKGHSTHRLNAAADKLCTRASAAQRAGKKAPGGPGWATVAPERKRSAVSAVAPAGARATTTRAASSAKDSVSRSAPSPARRATKAAPQGTQKSPVRTTRQRKAPEFLITSFDDGDDVGVVKKQSKVDGAYCDSCGGPINLLTSECFCSD